MLNCLKGPYTYEKKGEKRVQSCTSGNNKSRLSASFCASADGSKLPVVVVVPRKKNLKNFTPPSNILVVYKTSGTFDHKLIVDGI